MLNWYLVFMCFAVFPNNWHSSVSCSCYFLLFFSSSFVNYSLLAVAEWGIEVVQKYLFARVGKNWFLFLWPKFFHHCISAYVMQNENCMFNVKCFSSLFGFQAVTQTLALSFSNLHCKRDLWCFVLELNTFMPVQWTLTKCQNHKSKTEIVTVFHIFFLMNWDFL